MTENNRFAGLQRFTALELFLIEESAHEMARQRSGATVSQKNIMKPKPKITKQVKPYSYGIDKYTGERKKFRSRRPNKRSRRAKKS